MSFNGIKLAVIYCSYLQNVSLMTHYIKAFAENADFVDVVVGVFLP